jgi:glycosyltransferase involved in cell wall biosynthesis
MKLVVVQVGGVVAENQDFFARVQSISGWDVTLVVPRRFRDEAGIRQRASRWPDFHGGLIERRVIASPPIGRPGRNIPLHLYASSLGRIFEHERPDAVYVELDAYAASTFQAVRANRRTIDVPIGFSQCQTLAKRYPWPFSATERYVYREASFAAARTATAGRVLREKGYGGPLELLPFATDVSRYRPQQEPERIATGANGRSLTVGFVGRLVPEKGVDDLLCALAALGTDGTRALIVGGGPAESRLHQQAEELGLAGRVEWTGFVPAHQTAALYRRMDLIVVPSKRASTWTEQFGRVVIEALASGVPVLASDSGELPELIEQTGGGWTFPESDSAALAARLDELGRRPDELHDRGTRGRAAVEQLFSSEAVARKLVRIIEAAAA